MLEDIKRTLWAAADKLRANMDAAEYKHLVLGLIFVKYISDTFATRKAELTRRFTDENDEYFLHDCNADMLVAELEDRDYYREVNVFWVPETARWEALRGAAKQAAMNLAIRGIDFNLGREPADTFTRSQHPDLRADFILANPPFNISDWWHGSLEGDPRWIYGNPPQGNANYAWLQHMLFHLKPNGPAGIVLANGSMSSSQNSEGEIRKAMVDADAVEVMIALPGQLFFNTQIPACLWFLAKQKTSRDALPNATFVAFTGTPVSLEDRDTRSVFGEYIHIYDMQQAKEDGATVGIYFESRLAKLALKAEDLPDIDAEVDELAKDEEEDQQARLKSRWAALEKVVGAQPRIASVAADLVKHFAERNQAQTGKAMLVAMSREICVHLYDEIIKHSPDWHDSDPEKGAIKIIMTGSASDKALLRPHIYSKKQKKSGWRNVLKTQPTRCAW